MSRSWCTLPPAGLLLAAGGWWACTLAQAQGIYTCVDAKGRRQTSDRPILDCIDREQTELNATGTVRRKVGPSLTAAEQAAKDLEERRQAEANARANEEKRRDRALLVRYPNQASHDKERAAALHKVDEITASAHQRLDDLAEQRKKLEAENEFYRQDPSKQPPRLKRAMQENAQQVAAQQRFLAEQAGEKQRVSARFDEELGRLKQLWALQAMVPGAAPRQ